MGLLITNIKGLVASPPGSQGPVRGKELAELNVITDAFLWCSGGLISDYGRMGDRDLSELRDDEDKEVIDARGRFVFPSFCDSHTHLVYAGSREKEFTDRITGLSYEEIAARGGGILNSAVLLHNTGEDELYRQSMERIGEIISQGTGAVEIKSGYGLNTADELKMLRVIRRIRETAPIAVRATFLGAHAVPDEYRGRREEYVDVIINEMIPQVASEELADYIDVFCDDGFFTVHDTERILMAGLKYGLIPKIHANELGFSGGVETGVKYNALSVDHLERTGDKEIAALAASDTMPVLLPGSALFLGLPDAPAGKMIEAGLPVTLASDYNPGSCPTGNLKLIMSLACFKLGMLPAEALNAATINGAWAMGLGETHGSIAKGKVANVIITEEMPSVEYFAYAFGSGLVWKAVAGGGEQGAGGRERGAGSGEQGAGGRGRGA